MQRTLSPLSHLKAHCLRCSFGHLAACPPARSVFSGWTCLVASRLGSFGLEPCGCTGWLLVPGLRVRRLWSLSPFGCALLASRCFRLLPQIPCLTARFHASRRSFREARQITSTRASSLSRVSSSVCYKFSPELSCIFRRLRLS